MRESKPIDMHALRVFLATATDCNMSKAALRLGISQSAVSQTLRAMEDDFGTVLINRGARPLTLTPAGLALRNRGSALLEEAFNIRGSVLDASKGIKPNLSIGLVDSFAATCGALLAQSMIGNVSQLSIRTGLTPNLGEALVRRELDVAVSTDPLDGAVGISSHRLMSERFLVIQQKNAVTKVRSVADLAQLAKTIPIVRFNAQSHLGRQIDIALRRHQIETVRRVEVDTADTLTAMVAGGIGWAITTPLCLLQAARHADQVVPAIIKELSMTRSIYLSARRGEYDDFVMKVFATARSILTDSIVPELRRTYSGLEKHIEIEEWKNT